MLPFKNKNYFTLDNLSKYRHITLKFVGRYFYWAVKIRLRLFYEKIKNPTAIKPKGEGAKALMARPLVAELFFLRLP